MRGYVSTSCGQTHYRRHGDAGRAIILFHESPLSSSVFDRVLPLLGNSHRVFSLDTPGYGLSDPPDGPQEIEQYSTQLLEAISALGIEQFAVGGSHTGASLAVEVARQAGANRVTHLVLSGIALLTPEERAEYLANWSPDTEPDREGAYLQWAWERYQRIWGADSPPSLLNLGVTSILENLNRYNWAYNAAFRYDPAPALQAVRCPVLLLNSEHDLLNFTDARALELRPDAQLRIAAGLAGQLPWRNPEFYAREVSAFLSA